MSREVVVKAANSVAAASDNKWKELLTATGYDGCAAPAGTAPAQTAPAGTDPSFTGQPHDVEIDVSVAGPSANEQVWSGTLPTGEAWTVRITRVYDSFRMESEIRGLLHRTGSGSARSSGRRGRRSDVVLRMC